MRFELECLRRQRGFSRGELIGLAAVCVVAIGAFLTFGRPNPSPPVLTDPDNLIDLPGQVPDTAVTFEWNHGGVGRVKGGLPKRVSYFLVCAYEANTNQECRRSSDFGLGDPPDHWSMAKADEIDRTALTNVPTSPGGDTPFAYSFEMTLPQSSHEKFLNWTVGACASKNTRSCSFAEPRVFRLLARNMKAAGISDRVSSANNTVDIDVSIDSTGSLDTGKFNHQTSVWEVLSDSSGLPVTDVNGLMRGTVSAHNWPGNTLRLDDRIILKDGTVTSVLLLDLVPGGSGGADGPAQRDDSEVWAIIKREGASEHWWAEHPGIAANTTGLKFRPCARRLATPPPFCRVSVPLGPRPTLLAAINWIDSDNYVAEYDETDNMVMEKNIRVP